MIIAISNANSCLPAMRPPLSGFEVIKRCWGGFEPSRVDLSHGMRLERERERDDDRGVVEARLGRVSDRVRFPSTLSSLRVHIPCSSPEKTHIDQTNAKTHKEARS